VRSLLLAEWELAYRRGDVMQASLAIVGGFFGLVAFLSIFEWRWRSAPWSCSQIGPTRSS
jgi:hypothetical protein